jgi:trigger factor
VFDYYKSNPEALQTLRAPIFEEKVVDYILELSDVTDKRISKEELLADDEDDGEHHHHHEHDHDHAGHDHGSHGHAGHDHAGHAHHDH